MKKNIFVMAARAMMAAMVLMILLSLGGPLAPERKFMLDFIF